MFQEAHPNSLLATAQGEIRNRIRVGRKRADADLRSMEAWAAGGFLAKIETLDD